jgi:BirA family biotin operon repressor/biotin-[acetyl-CoA-carboxylase] ligase
MSWQRIDLASCASTNDEAARLARAGARHGTIVVADEQTAGRGRDGRAWTSPRGGLYASIVLRPSLPLVDVPPLTLALGIATCDAARDAGAAAHLKWPNDVLVGDRKLAGILVETHAHGGRLEAAIAGIGVNLAASDELAPHACALPYDRDAFLAILLAHVERWVDRYVASGLSAIVPAWQERMARGLAARAGDVTGEALGLDVDGALLLRDGAGRVHRVRAGDVEVVRAVP